MAAAAALRAPLWQGRARRASLSTLLCRLSGRPRQHRPAWPAIRPAPSAPPGLAGYQAGTVRAARLEMTKAAMNTRIIISTMVGAGALLRKKLA